MEGMLSEENSSKNIPFIDQESTYENKIAQQKENCFLANFRNYIFQQFRSKLSSLL